MNVLVLNGSPRPLGNTSKLINSFLTGLPREHKVKIYNLFDLMPTPCNACGYCKASDGCSKKDLDEFMGYYNESDVIIVATPVYNFSLPAPMKALFDRFQRFFEARFRRHIENVIEKPKRAVIIVTAGDDGKIGYEIIKKQIMAAFSVMNTKVVASILVSDTDKNTISEQDLYRVNELRKYIL